MSPRRRFADGGSATDSVGPEYFRVSPEPVRRWGLPVVAALATVVVTAAIAAGILMLLRQEAERRGELADAAAVGQAREFMTVYTTLDPVNANAYADAVLALSTGEFAALFDGRRTAIVRQVARSEPTAGTVVEAGVQRWNDDGSAEILLATRITVVAPDGKSATESASRWVATTVREGQRWKISNLVQLL